MNKSKTTVIFLWHMHQPCYKFVDRNMFYLPWVRLRGVKDYYGMARLVDKFGRIRVTFNFSGILLSQLKAYANGDTNDYYYLLSMKRPADLSPKEIKFIKERFFSVNIERFIKKNPRYSQLYNKSLSQKRFSLQEIRDLQVLFNLCWFHPYTISEDNILKEIIRKGSKYTEDDKKYVLDKQLAVMKEILPLYTKLWQDKRIEISLTPYYHPIMPLLYDTDIIKHFPYLNRPRQRFSYPQDCFYHLQEAKKIAREIFGSSISISGSWPSEGSVSEDVVGIYKKEKFKWIATDEEILFKSLATEYVSYDIIKNQRHLIYQPYNYRGVNIFFRDRNLSDMISFIYQGWMDSVFAARDLMEHFKKINYYLEDKSKHKVITIAMDGENAWEYYENNGVNFLETLYDSLERSDILFTDTPSNYLLNNSSHRLKKLSPGSWINGDFGVWIGSDANNKNWDILSRLRKVIERKKNRLKDEYSQVIKLFYVIEGSDWNWWNTFEDVHGSFKELFFSYVKEICKRIGEYPGKYLNGIK